MDEWKCQTEEEFGKFKERVLGSVDLSRKGSVDQPLVDLISLVNSRADFVTTSSCSGRIIVFSKEEGTKSGCKWHLVSHSCVSEDEILNALNQPSVETVVKFEPFIMHVACRTLAAVKTLQTVGVDAGLRNSGVILGKKGRLTLALRSNLTLEVPATIDSKMLLTPQYINCLVKIINDKMETNLRRISHLGKLCESALKDLKMDTSPTTSTLFVADSKEVNGTNPCSINNEKLLENVEK